VLLERFEDLLDRGLRQVIASDLSLEIVAHDVEHDRLPVTLRAHRPRVAILDVDALSNLSEVGTFAHDFPDTNLVLLVSRATTAECVQALAFGASAFLGRDTQARDVLTAIHLASRGLQLIPRSAREAVAPLSVGPRLLTRREAQVLPMLRRDDSNAQIAVALGIGVQTVRTHVSNIYRKLGVSSRRELATSAGDPGFTDTGEAPAPLQAARPLRSRPRHRGSLRH
jgi:DNA-binding NarL/FixJ family response regulator